MSMSKVTLYGSSLSLYTGRARSYLIKSGIPYQETLPNSPHFAKNVLPKMGERQSIPVIETEDGEVIRDGAAIIDHYESNNGQHFSPVTPKQKTLSLLFDVIGTEGLLRPAMHYRWDFPKENLDFLTFHFETFIPPIPNRKEVAEKQMNRMRSAGQNFGAVPANFELIESLYESLIEKLDQHFAQYPYLLGNKPCIGDFGLLAPFFGHLGRDPVAIRLIQTKAIRLFRWIERMNRPDPDFGEFGPVAEEYIAGDEIPDSLIGVLKHIAIDFVPETTASAATINHWLAENQAIPSKMAAERHMGFTKFAVGDSEIQASAQPYRFYLLSRMQSHIDSLPDHEKIATQELLQQCGMKSLLQTRLTRKIGRHNNREVWL